MGTEPAGAGPGKDAVHLVVALRHGKGYDFGTIAMHERFSQNLRDVTVQVDGNLTERERLDYSIGDELEDDEYMVSPLPTQIAVGITQEQSHRPRNNRSHPITTDDSLNFRNCLVTIGAMESFGVSGLREKPVAFYAIVRGLDVKDRVAYVRHMNPLRLTKAGNILGEFSDTLTRLEKPVFAMDDRADLIIRPTEIIILNKAFFDGLFFNLSGTDAHLDSIVAETLQKLPIEDETETMLLERSRSKKRMRRRMLAMHESGHLANVTLEDFKAALANYEIEEPRFVRNEKIYADEHDGEELLEILNEDLFRGALTGRTLAATRKRERKNV